MTKPTSQQVIALRNEFSLSRKEFGDITHSTERTVRSWEEGAIQMPAAHWAVYQIYFKKLPPNFWEEE